MTFLIAICTGEMSYFSLLICFAYSYIASQMEYKIRWLFTFCPPVSGRKFVNVLYVFLFFIGQCMWF